MCVAGGRRCPGSGTPSAKQRARRKANTAYRKAVAEAIEEQTGNKELASRVKDAPLTDVADVVTAAGLDGAAIAKKCGVATYTDKDGHTTTVDVEPAGTTRRTPVTDDTRACWLMCMTKQESTNLARLPKLWFPEIAQPKSNCVRVWTNT